MNECVSVCTCLCIYVCSVSIVSLSVTGLGLFCQGQVFEFSIDAEHNQHCDHLPVPIT